MLQPNVCTWCAGVAALLLSPSPSPSPILVQQHEHELHDGADESGWIVVGLDLIDSVAVDLGMPVVGLMRGDSFHYCLYICDLRIVYRHLIVKRAIQSGYGPFY